MEPFQIEPIGTVHSCFKAKFGTPRQSQIVKNSTGYIEVYKKWEPLKCLKGLESFSHAWVVFWFHENKNSIYRPIVRPPRLGRKGVGALATRSPLRPNPIGLSLVKIDRIIDNRVYVSGIDIIEGTPVLDIKPYIHDYDSVEDSHAGWLEDLESPEIEIHFSERASEDLKKISYPHLQKNIEDILKTDIRNRNDKSSKNKNKTLGFYFEDLNVVFECKENIIFVIKIERIKSPPASQSQRPAP